MSVLLFWYTETVGLKFPPVGGAYENVKLPKKPA